MTSNVYQMPCVYEIYLLKSSDYLNYSTIFYVYVWYKTCLGAWREKSYNENMGEIYNVYIISNRAFGSLAEIRILKLAVHINCWEAKG